MHSLCTPLLALPTNALHGLRDACIGELECDESSIQADASEDSDRKDAAFSEAFSDAVGSVVGGR